jgi:hypothetical protein
MRDARALVLRIGLAVLAVPALVVGVWAAFAPRSFYDDFPGFGRMWVAPDGPYNEHLVRDVGELNLAIAVVTVIALAALTPILVRAVLAGWLVYSVPHLVYHLRHLDPFATDDQVSIVASLALVPVLAIVLLVIELRGPAPERPATAASSASAASASGPKAGAPAAR